MGSLCLKGFGLVLVWYMTVHICAAAVSGTTCDPANNDAQTSVSTTCTAVDPNAECKTSETACSCKAGYKEGSGNTCVPVTGSGTTCDPANNDAQTSVSATCTAVDPNAECKTSETVCSCKTGYKEGSGNTCVPITVLETTCDPTSNDTHTGGAAVCTAVNANAECPDGTTKCACKAGYKQDATDGNTCVADPGSSASSPWMTTSFIGTCLLTVLLRLIS